MVRTDPGTAAAALDFSSILHVLTDDIRVQASPEFDPCQVAFLPMHSVVVTRRQQDGDVVFAQLLAQLRRY